MRFLLLFSITLLIVLTFCWLLIFCRRRTDRSKHGLPSTACHQGGSSTCSCQQQAVLSPYPALKSKPRSG